MLLAGSCSGQSNIRFQAYRLTEQNCDILEIGCVRVMGCAAQ